MSERYEDQTYYEILEVAPTAGPTEIYNAYQRAKSTYSVKSQALYSMFTPQEADELMSLIEEAYSTLSHQARRREYDARIGVAQPQQDRWVGPVKVFNQKKEELPQGFARTKFSVFEVNPVIEKEINEIEICDGLLLQKLRLYKGVTLDQVSEEIRVIKSTLVALEANDLEALPVAVFTRGFVVQIARVLGLNEKRISDAYMKYFRANKS